MASPEPAADAWMEALDVDAGVVAAAAARRDAEAAAEVGSQRCISSGSRLPVESPTWRMKEARRGMHTQTDLDAMLIFFQSAEPSAEQRALALRMLSREMAGFASWHESRADSYVRRMHTHVHNLDIQAVPESGIGHAIDVVPVTDECADIDASLGAMRRYWYRALRCDYPTSEEADSAVPVDGRALFIADSRMAHARLDGIIRVWQQDASDTATRTADIAHFLESLPYEDGHVRQDVAASLIRQHPHAVDILLFHPHMPHSHNFCPLLSQWAASLRLARSRIVPLLMRFDPRERMFMLNCLIHFSHERRRVAHTFINWPCKDDTDFVALLLRIMRPSDQAYLAMTLFDSFVPLERFGRPDADEAYFDAYFAPILDAAAPAYVCDIAGNLLCTLNHVPAFMVDRCVVGRVAPRDVDCARRDIHKKINRHNGAMRILHARVRVDNHRALQRRAMERPDVPLELDPLTQEPRHPDRACRICFENERIVCVLPCSHVASCVACFERLVVPKACPECLTAIAGAHTFR